ncbi:MAG TPA: hypothetical protein VK426_07555 [Methanobacterium sp.]|nr:hypothetical protein [Methanobacterium sp.]
MDLLEIGFLNTILIYVAIIVGIANSGILIGLVYFYRESYKQLESKFTIGLLYFTSILLIQNILAIIALALFLVLGVELHEFRGTEIYSILLLVNVAQLVALSILFKITWD